MAQASIITTSGTGIAADYIRLPKGWHRVFCRWAGEAGAGTLQERPAGSTDDDWADIPFDGAAADVTTDTSFVVAGGCELGVQIDTHASALTIRVETVE